MFISWYLISYSFALHVVMFLFFFTFLCECACMCSHSMCVQRARLCVCVQWVCHSAKHWTCCWQATVCGFSSWPCCSGGREWCVPPKPPAPPPSSVDRPTPCSPCSPFPGPQCLGCGLWMSATSWLSAQGLAGDWPVVEVQYQALSVSSSFHFLPPLSAGWAVVSGTNIL